MKTVGEAKSLHEGLKILIHIYMASKIKHRLNIFREKSFSKYEFIVVVFMILDKLVNNLQQILIPLALRLTARHGKCTLTPKNVPIYCPIVAFSYRFKMKIVSVIILQNKKQSQ